MLTNSIISISNVDSATIITNNSSKALQVNAVSGTYPYFQWKFNLDAERPLYVSVDVQTIGNSNFWFIGFNHKTLSDQKENFLYTNPTGIKWLATSGGNAKVIDVGSSTGSPVRRTFAVYSSQDVTIAGFQLDRGNSVYLDNLMFVPYYKITYCTPDGSSVLKTEYTLIDDKGNFLENFTPNYNPYGDALNGWATKQGGEPVTSVALNRADITLYANIDESKLAKVVYDANKPVLADAVSGMPADGYAVLNESNALSAVKPTAKYFVFKGWSKTQIALAAYKEEDLITEITPETTDAITLYAVWDYDYTALSMKSVEFGGDDEDEILDTLYQDRNLAYSKLTLQNGLGVYTPTAVFPDRVYNRFKINIAAKYSDGLNGDYNRIFLRARLSSNTNQAAMAVLNVNNTALGNHSSGVFWLTKSGNNESVAKPYTDELHEFKQSWNPDLTSTLNIIAVDALRLPTRAADESNALESANIDYIRFYRTGDKTVTYYMNDGTMETFDMDDKAAVGVGYRLTGKVPTRTGYVFRGWATSESDAKTETNLLDPSDAITIGNADVNLYACWLDTRPSSVGFEFDNSDKLTYTHQNSQPSFSNGIMTVTALVNMTGNYHYYVLDVSDLGLSADFDRAKARVRFNKKLPYMELKSTDNKSLATFGGKYADSLKEYESKFDYASMTNKNTLHFDALRKAYSIGDTSLVDYIRFYRTGDKTVTYYMNDNSGTAFATDTKAAVGVDYRLTGDVPAREGYVFLGWGTSPDATTTVASIDITNTSENNLYAIWKKDSVTVPTMIKKNSIRITGNTGIRFAAKVNLAAKNLAQAEEIGFIVGSKTALTAKDETMNNLVFGPSGPQAKGTTPDGTKYVYGVAYNKNDGTDIVYDNGGGSLGSDIKFGESEGITCVVYNIKNNNTSLAVRAYIKIGNNYYYSSPYARSMFEVAQELQNSDAFSSMSEEEQDYINNIVNGGSANA